MSISNVRVPSKFEPITLFAICDDVILFVANSPTPRLYTVPSHSTLSFEYPEKLILFFVFIYEAFHKLILAVPEKYKY